MEDYKTLPRWVGQHAVDEIKIRYTDDMSYLWRMIATDFHVPEAVYDDVIPAVKAYTDGELWSVYNLF